MISAYHESAKRTGAIIIPECGLDSAPADIVTFMLASHIRKTLHAPTLSVYYTLHDLKTGFSGGTSATALNIFSQYPMKKLAEVMKPYALSPVRPTDRAKPPPTSLLHRLCGLVDIPELGGVQTVGLMAVVDACIVHRSWGLFESQAKATSRPELSWGSRFNFREYMRANGVIHGWLFGLGLGLASLLLAFPLTRWILTPLVTKFMIPAPGEGPSKEKQKGDFLSYRALAIADTQKKEKVRARLDVAYGAYPTTALTMTAAADVILRGDLKATEAGRLGGGILTPATLGEQYLEKLRAFGMKIEIEE